MHLVTASSEGVGPLEGMDRIGVGYTQNSDHAPSNPVRPRAIEGPRVL